MKVEDGDDDAAISSYQAVALSIELSLLSPACSGHWVETLYLLAHLDRFEVLSFELRFEAKDSGTNRSRYWLLRQL